jgi:hypothetical protein
MRVESYIENECATAAEEQYIFFAPTRLVRLLPTTMHLFRLLRLQHDYFGYFLCYIKKDARGTALRISSYNN